jgi:Ca2+-transporting ATPase
LYIPIVADFFKLNRLNLQELSMCFVTAGVSVLWFEIYKWIKLNQKRKENVLC